MAYLGAAIHVLIATQLIIDAVKTRLLAEKVLISYAITEYISIEDALSC